MEIQKSKNLMPSSQDVDYEAALCWLKQNYPESRIHGCYRGSGWCVYVDNSLAIKESLFANNGNKLCNEFATAFEKQFEKQFDKSES